MNVGPLEARRAREIAVKEHYLHRKPMVRWAFGLYENDDVLGIVVFGQPMRHAQQSICPSAPGLVVELNRLWVDDSLGRNTESWFVARALKALPALIVMSYADTAQGHYGGIYRAANFHYAGRTDEERTLYDYVIPGSNGHSKGVKWGSPGAIKVIRSGKHKYWTTTGDRWVRRYLEGMVAWPSRPWKFGP